MSTKRADLQAQIDAIARQVKTEVDKLPRDAFGHGFLWGYVTVKLKNGKTREVKECLGGVCVANSREAIRVAESIPGVRGVWFNVD